MDSDGLTLQHRRKWYVALILSYCAGLGQMYNSQQGRIFMKQFLVNTFIVFVSVILFGCYNEPKKFIQFDKIPAQQQYPEYSITDTLSSAGGAAGDLAYLDALIRDQQLNEALYFCNTWLLRNRQSELAQHFRFKRVKIQFLLNFIDRHGISGLSDYKVMSPRTNLCSKSISNALNSYLAFEGIETCTTETDSSFSEVAYPTDDDVWFYISLKNATKAKLDSFNFNQADSVLLEEKKAIAVFLDDFEKEIVPLAAWNLVQQGSWDSANAYCDFMGAEYPAHSKPLADLKNSILARPLLPRKSKALAGITAAVLPGSGHVYCQEYKSGLFWLLGVGAQAGAAAFMLHDVKYPRDKSEIVFGALFSITGIITYIAHIKDAVSEVESHNNGLKKDEIRAYVKELKAPPPGVKKGE